MEGKRAGIVFSYYSNIGVAAIKLERPLKMGDMIQVKGATTDFTQQVGSMQVEHKTVKEAKKGQEIGIKVEDKVRKHDVVYLV